MAKILLIDDSESIRILLPEVLCEHQVAVAANWDEAEAMVHQQGVELALVDVNLPGVDGEQVAEVLQAAGIKVVLFSGMDESELMRRAQEVGAAGYVRKGLDDGALQEEIRRILA